MSTCKGPSTSVKSLSCWIDEMRIKGVNLTQEGSRLPATGTALGKVLKEEEGVF